MMKTVRLRVDIDPAANALGLDPFGNEVFSDDVVAQTEGTSTVDLTVQTPLASELSTCSIILAIANLVGMANIPTDDACAGTGGAVFIAATNAFAQRLWLASRSRS